MQELTSSQNAAVGLVCDTVEVCIDQPMLYWKNAAHQHLPFTLNPKLILMYRQIQFDVICR